MTKFTPEFNTVIDPKEQMSKVMFRSMEKGAAGILGKRMRVLILNPFSLVKGTIHPHWNCCDGLFRRRGSAVDGAETNGSDINQFGSGEL